MGKNDNAIIVSILVIVGFYIMINPEILSGLNIGAAINDIPIHSSVNSFVCPTTYSGQSVDYCEVRAGVKTSWQTSTVQYSIRAFNPSSGSYSNTVIWYSDGFESISYSPFVILQPSNSIGYYVRVLDSGQYKEFTTMQPYDWIIYYYKESSSSTSIPTTTSTLPGQTTFPTTIATTVPVTTTTLLPGVAYYYIFNGGCSELPNYQGGNVNVYLSLSECQLALDAENNGRLGILGIGIVLIIILGGIVFVIRRK